jgi:cytoskeleton protein RodZ
VPRPVPASTEKAPSPEIPFPTERTFNWHKYAVAAIAALVPLVIYEFYFDATPEVAVKSGQVELPPPQAVAETTPTEPIAVAVQNVASPVTPAKEAASDKAQQKTDLRARDAAAAQDVKPMQPAQGEQVVRMRFARESWVEIRDRNGRKIFSQLNPPGTEQVVSGLPPLSLVVGNANGVQLTHNEQPVDLGPHIKIDVARLTLE